MVARLMKTWTTMNPEQTPTSELPPIPAKRYFTIGEVSELCGVKPHVLRYWEQEFTQLKPLKRRGNRRYYQHHEVLLVRKIRELLYEHGYTINGARNKLDDVSGTNTRPLVALAARPEASIAEADLVVPVVPAGPIERVKPDWTKIRGELEALLKLLQVSPVEANG
jgi:DNA-binding transcriptional MerR regulator